MKEVYSGGLVLNIESCDHVAGIDVSEVLTAEFDTSEGKIATRYSGMRRVFCETVPLPTKILEILAVHGFSDIESHFSGCSRIGIYTVYVPTLEELRTLLEFDVLPSMLPDFVESNDFEVEEILNGFREEIPTFAKRLTKLVRAELARLHVMDEED